MRHIVTIIVGVLILIPYVAYSQSNADYLILTDIGDYKKITKGGPSGNILAGVGHFGFDHKDKSYGIAYVNDITQLWIDVQVTQHSGSDSDKWLLHEVEDIFRSNRKLGELISGTEILMVNGNRIFNWVSYAWISGNKVVYINWTPKPNVQNPEPLEIVQAYLQKHPSTIPSTLVLDRAHSEKWIKDEMDRRLWLCDKWFLQLQLGKAELSKVLQESVDHMNVFLDYREKYYGISATNEKKALWEYLQANNGTGIKNKLTEYKTWWSANKGGSINLP